MTVEPKKAELSEESIDAKVKRFTSVKDVVATIGLIALPVFSLRVLSVSHYDLDTALALLQNTPLASFTYANVMTITPLLSYIAGVALLRYEQRRYPIRRREPLTWLAAAFTYLLSLLFCFPVLMQADVGTWVMVLIMPFFAFIDRAFTSYLLATLSILLYFLFAYSLVIWLPPENLNVDGKVQTLYVLQPQDSDLVVFDPDHHTVVRISKASVESRVYCDDGLTGQISEILLSRPTGRPMCANYHPSATR